MFLIGGPRYSIVVEGVESKERKMEGQIMLFQRRKNSFIRTIKSENAAIKM